MSKAKLRASWLRMLERAEHGTRVRGSAPVALADRMIAAGLLCTPRLECRYVELTDAGRAALALAREKEAER